MRRLPSLIQQPRILRLHFKEHNGSLIRYINTSGVNYRLTPIIAALSTHDVPAGSGGTII